MEIIVKTILTGIGATLAVDLWVFILRRFQISSLDYRYVGRWIGYFPKGTYLHHTIVTAAPIKYEAVIGWTAHYTIGVSFACLLLLVNGGEWLSSPTLMPALILGIGTVIAPLFIMQPAFGFGIASSKLPRSNFLRLKSVMTHLVFGFGLYGTALLLTIF